MRFSAVLQVHTHDFHVDTLKRRVSVYLFHASACDFDASLSDFAVSLKRNAPTCSRSQPHWHNEWRGGAARLDPQVSPAALALAQRLIEPELRSWEHASPGRCWPRPRGQRLARDMGTNLWNISGRPGFPRGRGKLRPRAGAVPFNFGVRLKTARTPPA